MWVPRIDRRDVLVQSSTMKTLSADRAEREFDALLDGLDEPVAIERDAMTVAIIVSAEHYQMLQARVQNGTQAKAGEPEPE